jgi:hypothetical protein
MTPRADGSDEDIRKLMEEGQRNSAVVIGRLEQLVKKGVIADYDLTYTPTVSGNRTVPRIIWTIERLLAEGHLAGIEEAVKGFSYLVGKGMGSQKAVKNKQGKKTDR